MNANRSTVVHHLTAALILRWVAFYTRGLPHGVADARRDEIASDIYEQSANLQLGVAARRRLAASLAFRAVRGIAADVAWRNTQSQRSRHERHAMPNNSPRPRKALGALVTVVAALLTFSGAFAAIRVLSNPTGQTPELLPVILTMLTAATCTGLILSRWPSTNLAGLILLAVASVPLMWGVGRSLWAISSTVAETIMIALTTSNQQRPENAVYLATALGAFAAILFTVAAIVVHCNASSETLGSSKPLS